jgi:hypothetical protein
VTDHGEGELSMIETMQTNGKGFVNVLDFVEMNLGDELDNPSQPENWAYLGPGQWVNANSKFEKCPFYLIDEKPKNLWLDSDDRNDRVSVDFISESPPKRSLVVIQPTNFRLQLATRYNKPKRRAIFTYRGDEYDLSMTDPVIEQKYCRRVPQQGMPAKEITLPCGDHCRVCISLAGAFQGYHYKVVATVFEDVE